MISKNNINQQVIEAVAVTKSIQNKYGISGADYAELHNAFLKIHTEDLLKEANTAVKEYSTAKQKDLVTMKFLSWIQKQLARPFKDLADLPDVAKYKGRL